MSRADGTASTVLAQTDPGCTAVPGDPHLRAWFAARRHLLCCGIQQRPREPVHYARRVARPTSPLPTFLVVAHRQVRLVALPLASRRGPRTHWSSIIWRPRGPLARSSRPAHALFGQSWSRSSRHREAPRLRVPGLEVPCCRCEGAYREARELRERAGVPIDRRAPPVQSFTFLLLSTLDPPGPLCAVASGRSA